MDGNEYLCMQNPLRIRTNTYFYFSMEENEPKRTKSNPVAHAMRYGLVLGACFTANFLLSASSTPLLALLTYPIQIYIWVFAYRSARTFRDNECGGIIGYRSVVSYITQLFFFGALIGGVIELIYLKYIAPDYLENMFNEAMLLLEQLNIDLPEASIDTAHSLMRPTQYVLQFITGKCIGGLLLGLIYAFFIRKKATV